MSGHQHLHPSAPPPSSPHHPSAPPPSYSEVCPSPPPPLNPSLNYRTTLAVVVAAVFSVVVVVLAVLVAVLVVEVAELRSSVAGLDREAVGEVAAALAEVQTKVHNSTRYYRGLMAKLNSLYQRVSVLEATRGSSRARHTEQLLASSARALPTLPTTLAALFLLSYLI